MKKLLLPLALMGVFALSRLPGCLPDNFSAAYALMFCAGVYFPRRLAWWLPIAVMLVTDFGLNLHYQVASHVPAFSAAGLSYLGTNYMAYTALIWLGRRFRPQDHWGSLLGGGVLGALFFYVLTNTASWLLNPFNNPEYTRSLMGWFTALTKGTAGYPQTWEFFRNTLLSGGLFTGLFAGIMKLSEPCDEEDLARETEPRVVETEAPEEAEA